MNIFDLQQRAAGFDLRLALTEVLLKMEQDVLNANREQMLYGFNADGSMIGRYKSELYAEGKYAMNPRAGFGNVDLRLTGAMFNSLYLDWETYVNATVMYDLQEKYGENFLGIGGPYRLKVLNSFVPKAKEKLKKELTT